MKKQSRGFTLLEMLTAAAIVAGVTAWVIPKYIRSLRQAEVDSYTQSIEAGFYNLRSEIGNSRTTCQLNFDKAKIWLTPQELLEFRQNDGTVANTGRLRCCNSQIEKAKQTDECEDGPLIGALLNSTASSGTSSFRFIRREGSSASRKVEVAVSRNEYEITPPGTSARTEPITFMVRAVGADMDSNLRSRCIQIAGNGHLDSGTWEGSLNSGQCLTKAED